MFILAINTVLSPNGVHLFSLKKGKAECLAKKTWSKSASHSEKLLPAIESVFTKVKKTWSNLDAIFVVNGPGPFTSLRVGIAVANSAGFALKIPVYSVPNLISKIPEIEQKKAFHPIVPIYGREPNISKPRCP